VRLAIPRRRAAAVRSRSQSRSAPTSRQPISPADVCARTKSRP
jgi:hypothetical protein